MKTSSYDSEVDCSECGQDDALADDRLTEQPVTEDQYEPSSALVEEVYEILKCRHVESVQSNAESTIKVQSTEYSQTQTESSADKYSDTASFVSRMLFCKPVEVCPVTDERKQSKEVVSQDYSHITQTEPCSENWSDTASLPERCASEVYAVPNETTSPSKIPSPEYTMNARESSAEKWSDTTSLVSLPDRGEPSEVYYTASSEVSLLSDLEDRNLEMQESAKEEKRECIAGHVAAMRERFESMTRANTPCVDLARSLSPSLDLVRIRTPSPDLTGA